MLRKGSPMKIFCITHLNLTIYAIVIDSKHTKWNVDQKPKTMSARTYNVCLHANKATDDGFY